MFTPLFGFGVEAGLSLNWRRSNMSLHSDVLRKTASQIALEIVNAYENSQGIFTEKTNAEDLVPEANIETQSQFLFWVIQMDYSTKSAKLYENANTLFDKTPEWIDTKYLQNSSQQQLDKMIRESLKPRYPNEIVNRFQLNSQKLIDEYSGKALNIVNASTSAKELLKKILEFRGFGPKLGNFLTRTYIDLLKLDYSDIEDILQPVDVHDMRLTYEWGLVSKNELSDKNIQFVKELWSTACKNAKVSWITFDKALWLIGSKGKRSEDPQKDYATNLGF
jgi:hypothetical protein